MEAKDLKRIVTKIPVFKNDLLEALKEFSKQEGLRSLSKMLNVDPSHLSRVLNGKEVSIETLAGYVQIILENRGIK